MMKKYCHFHTVSFEETNLVGNVYFSNFIKWQGTCREMFLKDHAPEVIQQIKDGLALITLSCSCDYYDQLFAFDRIRIEMSLVEQIQNRVKMEFSYVKEQENKEDVIVALGIQEICVMENGADGLQVCQIPVELNEALSIFSN